MWIGVLLLIVVCIGAYCILDKTALRIFLFIALVKSLAAVFVTWLYLHYYKEGDLFQVQLELDKILALFKTDIGGYIEFFFKRGNASVLDSAINPRTGFYLTLISPLYIVFAGNIWMTGIGLSLLGAIAIFFFWNKCASFYSNPVHHYMLLVILLVPSLVLSSSGVLKETLVLALLFTALGFAVQIVLAQKGRWQLLFAIVFCTLLIYQLKYYVVALLVVVLIPSLLFFRLKRAFNYVRLVFVIIALVVLVQLVSLIHPNFAYSYFLTALEKNRSAILLLNFNGPVINFEWQGVSFWSGIGLIKMMLEGVIRPYLWEKGSLFVRYVAIENSVLFVLIWSNYKAIYKKLNGDHRYWYWVALLYFFIALLLFTYTTPVLGSLCRYKNYYMYILWFFAFDRHPIITKVLAKVSFVK